MRTKLQTGMTILFSALLMLLGITILPADAAEVRIYDEGNRLSGAELTECETYLRQASEDTGMNIVVILGVGARSDLTIESTCKAAYTELFGVKADGLSYYIDLKGASPYDYIATFGRGSFYYTPENPDRIYAMEDQVAPSLRPVGSENVVEAVQKFSELVKYYYQQGVPEYYYLYDTETRMYYHLEDGEMVATNTKPFRNPAVMIVTAGGFLLFGLLLACGVYAGVKQRYQFKSELSPTTYVNRKNVNYREQYDRFTHANTTRVVIQSSSSSGGGGGFSGGGGHISGGIGGGGYHR